jgi:predicted O-methyltransferase YrrM
MEPLPAPALDRIEQELATAYAEGWIEDEDGRRVDLVPDGVNDAQGRALTDLVAAEGAQRSVEVGFALGLSCLHICAGLLRAGSAEAAHVAIDPTEAPHWRNAGRLLVRRAGAEGMVELIEEESQVALGRLLAEERRFDFAFVDGDHRFDPAFVDIYFSTRLVRPGGLIVVDDMWMPAVRLAVAYFEANLGLELLPDAGPAAFRWRPRRRLAKGVREGDGEMAVLRVPDPPPDRPWDHFTDFR